MATAGAGSLTHPPRLSAAVVIVTYERPEILRDTLEYWRRVAPGPDQFLVIDASASAADYRAAVLGEFPELFGSPGSDYVIATRPSITAQRNEGLDRVETDVVLFTDDESRPEPDYVAKILEVYERDPGRRVGGVGGSERDEETSAAQFRLRIQNLGRLIARRFAGPPPPRRWRAVSQPGGFEHLPVVAVRGLHGAKMSFRSDLAKQLRFDPHMLRYGYCEDLDMSVRVGATHLLLQRKDAFIVHDESEQARVPTQAGFLVSWVNPAYLTEKLCPAKPRRGPLQRLLYAKQINELLRPATLLRRQQRAAVQERYALARRMIGYLQSSPPGELSVRFGRLQSYIFELPPVPERPDRSLRLLDHFVDWLRDQDGRTPSLAATDG